MSSSGRPALFLTDFDALGNKVGAYLYTFIFVFISLVASILKISTGFGFLILATPFLLLLFEPMVAIQINLIVSLTVYEKSRYRINSIKKLSRISQQLKVA